MNEYLLENWGQHQFTQGTWTQAFQEKGSNLKVLIPPLSKMVYFAGEINDPYKQMGVPGAILSGYYSIDKLLTVASLLNINLDELLDIPPWEAIPKECEISKEVRALDEESYQLILALIREINAKGRV